MCSRSSSQLQGPRAAASPLASRTSLLAARSALLRESCFTAVIHFECLLCCSPGEVIVLSQHSLRKVAYLSIPTAASTQHRAGWAQSMQGCWCQVAVLQGSGVPSICPHSSPLLEEVQHSWTLSPLLTTGVVFLGQVLLLWWARQGKGRC